LSKQFEIASLVNKKILDLNSPTLLIFALGGQTTSTKQNKTKQNNTTQHNTTQKKAPSDKYFPN